MLHRLSYKTLLSIVVFLLIGIVVLLKISSKTNVKAAWFNDSWQYRKSITVTNNTTVESNVYIQLTFNIGSTANAQSDDGDLRFTKVNGEVLPYYIVSGTGTTAVVVNVSLDSFPSGTQIIYGYYGNPTAPNGFSVSNFSTQASNYTIGSLGSQEVGGGPIAYWKFDEAGGITVYDSTQDGFNGTFGTGDSAPTRVTEDSCISGRCLQFDGTNDYVAIGSTINNVQSISFWLKPVSVGQSIISLGPSSIYLDSSSQIGTSGFSSPTVYVNGRIASAVTLGQWQYISITTATPITGNNINIGRVSTSYTNASFDDFKIYSYSRSALQTKTDYNSRGSAKGNSANLGNNKNNSVAFSDGLVGFWKMDENSWTNDCSTASITDSSGNLNHLRSCPSSTGSTGTTTGKFGNAGQFDGGNDYGQIESSSAFEIGGPLTLATWVNPTAVASEQTLAGNWDETTGGNSRSYRIYINSSAKFCGDISSDGSSSTVYSECSTTSLTASSFSHVAMTVQRVGSNYLDIRLFINGAENTTTTSGSPITSIKSY